MKFTQKANVVFLNFVFKISLTNFKTTNLTVSFFIVLTIVSMC